jgi:general secretion pathway protein A
LNEETATVVLGDGIVKEVPLSALEKSWNGAYSLLWRAPPKYKGALRTGAKGEAVTWLREQLAKANGRNIGTDLEPRFDSELAHQVREFQIAEHLVPSGGAGTLTLIRLTTRADDNVPRLMN